MVSVTSEITASKSFQAPPPRTKTDPSPANDSFASLVDSNTTAAANNNDRVQERAQEASSQQAASDKRPAPPRRDDAAAADKQSRDVAAAEPAGTDRPVETGAHKRAETKSSADRTDDSKPVEKPSPDEATDSADTQAAADEANAETADAVAAAITAVVATDVQAPAAPAAVSTTTTSASPLAMAAAAPAADIAGAANKGAAAAVEADAQANASELITKAGQSENATTIPAIALKATQPATAKTSAAAKASTAVGDSAASDGSETSTTSTGTPATNTTAAIASGSEQPAGAKPSVNLHAMPTTESAGAQAPSATVAHNMVSHDAAPGQSNAAQAGTVQAAPSFQPLMQMTGPQSQPSFTVTAATQSAAVPLSGLAIEIAASVRSGKSRFEIRLDPAELGRIDVRIDIDRNGHMTSHLTVEKPETLSMLRQDAPQLQRALNDAGLSTGDSGLQFSLRDQSSSGQNGNQSNPNAQRLILTEEETVPAAVASSYGRMLSSSSGVDIRV